MKKLLASAVFATALSTSASAGLVGLDWEATGEYNLDTEVTALSAEVGRTFSVGGMELSVDADFDLDAANFSGTDWKLNYGLSSGVDAYVKSGLTKDWGREDVVLGVTVSF